MGPARAHHTSALWSVRSFYRCNQDCRHYAFPGGKMDVSNQTFGADPFKGERKTLHVVFDTPNGGFKRDFDEGDTVRFGGR
jgi:hypothetical protein